MPNVIRILRSATSGSTPTAKTEGEPFFNEADKQFGVVDAAGVAQALVAVRFFSALGTYAVGDIVVNGGLFSCNTAIVVPGPFDPLEWTSVGGAADLSSYATIAYVDAENDAQDAAAAAAALTYLPLTAGATKALTGPLFTHGLAPVDPTEATDKQYVDDADTVLQDQITVLASNLIFSGSLAVVTDVGDYTVASGMADGPLPPATGNANKYVIVTDGGTAAAGNIPAGDYNPADWLVSDGTIWHRMPIGQGAATAVTAPMVALTPDINGYGDVQVAIQDLFDVKLDDNSIIDAGTY